MLARKIVFLTVLALSLGLASTAYANGSIKKFSIGYTLSPGSARDLVAHKFKDALEKKSDGKMTLVLYPQSQLGGEVEMQEAAQAGSVDIVLTSSSTLVNIDKRWGILDLPYLFDSLEQANKAVRSAAGDQLLDTLPEHGLIGLGWAETVDRNVFGNRAIKEPGDLKGFKIRVIEDPGYVKTYKALGAQPTPMGYDELYTALQQGVVDGGDTSPDQFVLDKFIEVSDYFSLTQMNYIAIPAVMSKSTWDNLSSQEQATVKDAFSVASNFAPKEFKKQHDEYLEKMKEKGIKIITPDLDAFKEATEGVKQKLINEVPDGRELYDAFQKAKG